MKLLETEDGTSRKINIENCHELHSVSSSEVLAELVELLEEYAPSWYTEELHNRAMAALQR